MRTQQRPWQIIVRILSSLLILLHNQFRVSCFVIHHRGGDSLLSRQLQSVSSRSLVGEVLQGTCCAEDSARLGRGWRSRLPLTKPSISLLVLSLSADDASGATTSSSSSSSTTTRRMGELTRAEEQVYNIMKQIHESPYSWRMVVIGKGAIIESTVAPFELEIRISQQPSTGANLLTMASADNSFEFHLNLVQVSRVAFVIKETPKKTFRLLRMMNSSQEPMCSLILFDESDSAQKWFQDIVEIYGSEIQL